MAAIIIIAVIAVILVVVNIRVVQQARAFVIERLGAYKETWNVGLHVKMPFIDRVAKIVSLKEQVADFPPQPVITKDNVTMQIDTVVYFQITDPKLFTYGIEQPMVAIENLSATTLRNIIGDLELDQCLTSRDIINSNMRSVLDLLGREDVLQLHAVDLDAPGVGGLVENRAHLGVDDIAAGQALIELEIADDVTQGGGGEVLDGDHGLLDAVGVELGVGDLEIDHGVDLHGNVILRDNRLGREVRHLLLEGDDLRHALNEGNLEVQTDVPGGLVGAQALDDIGLRLLDNADVADNKEYNDQNQN